MGGDGGCAVIIDGLLQALEHHDHIRTMYLVGDEETIRASLGQAGHLAPRIEVVHSPEVLSMEEKPVVGLRHKKKCSLAMATDLVKLGQADAVLSAGNTGGMVAAASIKLRTLPGVDRPGIATVMPTKTSNFVLLDAGANVEGKPRHLMHYAIMGDIYAREVLGKSRPRVGLLSVGTEEAKGNDLTVETFKLCSALDLNFIGNVEGHDLFREELDVVVCNGFVGNIVLKTCESLALHMMGWLRDELTATPIRRLGAALSKVTAEVAPHHLIFNEEDIGEYDTHYKMNPPLRTAEDNAALLEGLKEGVFDLIATDHAPHSEFEKAQDFVSAPNGIIGLETALVSLHDRFISTGQFGWDLLVKRYSAEPRRVMGLDPVAIEEGKPAELIVFDPAGETTFSRDFMRSRSVNTPFLGQTLKGRVEMVVRGSEVLLER